MKLRPSVFFALAALLLVVSFTVTTGASASYALIPRLGALLLGCMGLVARDALTGSLATAASAFAFNAYLFQRKLEATAGPSLCNIDSVFDCDKVNTSPWSMAFGVPITLFGMAFYAGIATAALVAPTGNARTPAFYRMLGLFTLPALAYSALLAVISEQIGAFCVFCISIYLSNGVLLWAALRGLAEQQARLLDGLGGLFTGREATALVGTFVIGNAWGSWYYHDHLQSTKIEIPRKPEPASPDRPAPPPQPSDQAMIAALYQQPRGAVEVTGKEPTLGAAEPKYTIIEFADFGCPHCAEASSEVKDLVHMNPDVQVRFKYFPLTPACNPMIAALSDEPDPDPGRCRAAYAAECAHQQGKFWEMSSALFNNQGAFPPEQLREIAASLKLDVGAWEACLTNPRTATAVEGAARAGETAGVSGTPTFYVKGLFGDQWVAVTRGVPVVLQLLEAHRDGVPLPDPPPPQRP